MAKYGIGWRTLQKMLAHDEPPGYRQSKQRPKPKLDAFLPLLRQMLEDDGKAPTKQKHTARRIFERLRDDSAAFLPLPPRPFESRRVAEGTVNSESLVRFETNDYSVPVRYAHRKVIVTATVDEVRFVSEDRLLARDPRCWDREKTFFEPVHYLALLERKPGGFDHAKPLEHWHLPECFALLRRRMEAEDSKSGTRSHIRVLAAYQALLEEVAS